MSSAPPTAEIDDPLLRRRIDEARGQGGHAYLLALAAWQRGLEVRFHTTFAEVPRFAHLARSGASGELLTLSDGQRRHAFFRLLGDATSREASAICESKPQTRQRWQAAGVAIPPGGVVTPGEGGQGLARLLGRYPRARFVLKPVDGSLGQGVQRDLSAAEVRAAVRRAERPLLLELAIPGTEFRVHVVGERVVAAVIRRPASVVGDGRHTLEALIRDKEAARRRHSEYADHAELLDDYARRFLQAAGRALDAVPAAGERVFVSDIADTHRGGDLIEGQAQLSAAIGAQCVAACRALALPNAGLDLIVSRDGAGRPKAVFLEANQNPYIRHLSCPLPGVYAGCGNRVAEAIVDHYFPDSRGRPRLTRASFDFTAICRMLASGAVASVCLPRLGDDWRQRRRHLSPAEATSVDLRRARERALGLGVHAQWLHAPGGGVLIDLVGAPAALDAVDAEVSARA